VAAPQKTLRTLPLRARLCNAFYRSLL